MKRFLSNQQTQKKVLFLGDQSSVGGVFRVEIMSGFWCSNEKADVEISEILNEIPKGRGKRESGSYWSRNGTRLQLGRDKAPAVQRVGGNMYFNLLVCVITLVNVLVLSTSWVVLALGLFLHFSSARYLFL